MLDGYVARRMKINSVVGSYLDPLADKVLIGCVALGMVHKELLHPGLVGIIVLRDVGLVGGAVYLRASSLGWKLVRFFNLDGTRPQKIEPLFISKVNTVFQLILVYSSSPPTRVWNTRNSDICNRLELVGCVNNNDINMCILSTTHEKIGVHCSEMLIF